MLLVWKISTRSSTYGKSTSMDVNLQLNFVLSDQIKTRISIFFAAQNLIRYPAGIIGKLL